MRTNTIDISKPIREILLGIAIAVSVPLTVLLIKLVLKSQAPTGNYITTNAKVINSYYIENKEMYLVELTYMNNSIPYVVYVYKESNAIYGNEIMIGYSQNNNKCIYEGKEYLAQPLIGANE